MRDQIKTELMDAVVCGVREYWRSIRGARVVVALVHERRDKLQVSLYAERADVVSLILVDPSNSEGVLVAIKTLRDLVNDGDVEGVLGPVLSHLDEAADLIEFKGREER